MLSNAVLVLSAESNRELLDLLMDEGFPPLVRKTISAALDAVRHERLAAIVVDRDRADVDVLEFVLNVRDMDPQTPVLVVGEPDADENERALQRLEGTYVVGGNGQRERLSEQLSRAVSAGQSSE